MVNEPVAVFTCPNPEGYAYVADREPKKPTVQNTEETKIVRAETTRSVREVNAVTINEETRSFANVWKDYLGRSEIFVVVARAKFPPVVALVLSLL